MHSPKSAFLCRTKYYTMNKLQTLLYRLFATNFMLYYQSHAAHVNVGGRNFYSDHKILDEIYSDAQENIDTIAEFLQTLECEMPRTLAEILDNSEISDRYTEKSPPLGKVYDDIETVIAVLDELYPVAEAAKQYGISGYVQERLITHRKQCWQLRKILGD